jgi:hypothetical protein
MNSPRVRLSAARFPPPEKARDLEAARAVALEWERTGIIARPAEYAPIPAPLPGVPEDSGAITVEKAVAAFMADSRDRENSESAQKKAHDLRTPRDPKNPSA